MIESIFIAVLVVLIYIFFIKNQLELLSVDIEGYPILVRKTLDYKDSAQLLYELIKRMFLLREHLRVNIDFFPTMKKYILLLLNNFSKEKTLIYENDLNSDYTSYNVNKGEEIVFCLRCKTKKTLHNINLLTYVAVHEMAHSGCPENGHTPLFDKIFHFFLNESVKIGIYYFEDYNRNPVMYCGMEVYTNILNYDYKY